MNHAKDFFNYDTRINFKSVKLPKFNNERTGFLTHEEASTLLEELKNHSQQLYEISIFSIMTGARADEILSMKWGDIDFNTKTAILWDTKNTKNRKIQINVEIATMLTAKTPGPSNEYIFQSRKGGKMKQVSKVFDRVVKQLGLNDNLSDPRQKIVFHSLRHTFASWLIQDGVDLYRLSNLLGHSTLAMTQRYAHLSTGDFQNAVNKLDGVINIDSNDGVET